VCCQKMGEARLKEPPRSLPTGRFVRRHLSKTHGTLSLLFNSVLDEICEGGERSLSLRPMSVSQARERNSEVRRVLDKNKATAAGFVERNDIGTIAKETAKISMDIRSLRSFGCRLAALALARLLRKQELDGISPGVQPALAVLRESLERMGWVRAALKGGVLKEVLEEDGTCEVASLGKAVFNALSELTGKKVSWKRPSSPLSFPFSSPFSPSSLFGRFFRLPASFVPQSIIFEKDTKAFSGLLALRNPFDTSLELVNGVKAMIKGLRRTWILVTEDTSLEPLEPFGATGLYWKQLPEGVTREHVIEVRCMLLRRGLDHRCFSAFGPIFSSAAGSFLLRVVGSVMSTEDYSLKMHQVNDFEAYMGAETPRMRKRAPSDMADDTALFEASVFNSSVFGKRLTLEEISCTTEYCILNFEDEPKALNGYSRDDDFVHDVGLENLSYTVPSILASADYCRKWLGVSVSRPSQPAYYTACNVDNFPPGSIGFMLESCGRMAPTRKFEFRMESYWNLSENPQRHPNLDLFLPLLHVLGCNKGSPWGILLDRTVHTTSGIVLSLENDLDLLEIFNEVKKFCLTEGPILPLSCLFLLESGVFRAPCEAPPSGTVSRYRGLINGLRNKLLHGNDSVSRDCVLEVQKESICKIISSFHHMLPDASELFALADLYISS
jgi:hypothetical protein